MQNNQYDRVNTKQRNNTTKRKKAGRKEGNRRKKNWQEVIFPQTVHLQKANNEDL